MARKQKSASVDPTTGEECLKIATVYNANRDYNVITHPKIAHAKKPDNIKIKVGTFWLMRDGGLVLITSIDQSRYFSVFGSMIETNKQNQFWKRNGRFTADDIPSRFDLVAPIPNDLCVTVLEIMKLKSSNPALESDNIPEYPVPKSDKMLGVHLDHESFKKRIYTYG